MEWGIFVPLTFVVSYAAAHDQDATEAYVLLSLLNAGSVVGRFLPGLLSDRFGRFNTIAVTNALCAVTVFGMWLPAGDSRGVLIAFAVLFGFASGSNLCLSSICIGQLCDAGDYGRYVSTAMIIASFGTLTSLPIGGALLNLGGGETGWAAMIVFSGTSYVLAMVCYATARVRAVGWNWRTIF
jgi:MFS family permease